MTGEVLALAGAAAAVGIVHTLAGPDHYIPFVAMARARGWSTLRTGVITALCGVGHVGSSIVLGIFGIGGLVVAAELMGFEESRGNVASWLMIAFGLVYMVWGICRAVRGRPHTHAHIHVDGGHAHEHTHDDEHLHVHDGAKVSITPWVLFTIFVFGPCEPLIPMMMGPKDAWGVTAVALTFSVATIATMLAVVLPASMAARLAKMGSLEKYSHAFAGAAVLACGVLIQVGF
jgi:hypothetical protein